MPNTLHDSNEGERSTLIIDGVRIDHDYDNTELRESLKSYGWVEHLPALRDENGRILVGQRRIKLADELGIKPNIVTLPPFGQGDEADAERLKLAIASNIGFRGLTTKDRQHITKHLYGEHDWTMQRIADALDVSVDTVSRDLSDFPTVGKSKPHAKTASNPKGSGRPKGKGDTRPRTKSSAKSAEKSTDSSDDSGDVVVLADARAKRGKDKDSSESSGNGNGSRHNLGTKIRDEFGDGKWHKLQTIVTRLGSNEDHIRRILATMAKSPNTYKAKSDSKKVGKDTEYRIWRLDNTKVVSVLELFEKLGPIIKLLEVEGRKNMATMAPGQVAALAGELRQLLDAWAE